MLRALLSFLLGLMAVAAGCSTPTAKIVVPGSALQHPEYGSKERYVIRMSDGERDWEVELPETNGGYEVRIPVESGETLTWDPHRLTDADKELLRAMGRGTSIPGDELGPVDVIVGGGLGQQEAQSPDDPQQPTPAASNETAAGSPAQSPPSYLLGIEDINQLYRAGQYELALVRLSRLQKAYPEDVKLLAMKGTLWLRLGRPGLAREAWEQVLRIDPNNRTVLSALRQMGS